MLINKQINHTTLNVRCQLVYSVGSQANGELEEKGFEATLLYGAAVAAAGYFCVEGPHKTQAGDWGST